MLTNFSKTISKKNKIEIIKAQKVPKRIFLLYFLLFLGSIVRAVATNKVTLALSLAIIEPVIILCYGLINLAIQNGITQILTEELLPHKFLDVIESAFPYKKGSKAHSDKENYFLGQALAYISLGKFKESSDSLSNLIPDYFKGPQKQIRLAQYYYLEALNNFFKNSDFDLKTVQKQLNGLQVRSSISQEFISKRKKILEGIYQIHNGDLNYYFDSPNYTNKLEELLFLYFQAKNALNDNKPEKAISVFGKISTENPELFYVQEAKKYLEELTND